MLRGSGGTQPSRERVMRWLAIAAALSILAACNVTGDFGRIERVVEPVPARVQDPEVTGSVSTFALTDEERQLRDLARNLLAPPLTERAWLAAAEEPPARGSLDQRYVTYLVDGPFRSSTARYSRLIDDTRNDIARLEPFFLLARRVADLDVKRDRSLAHVSGLTQEEALNAQRRIRENMMLIAEVHRVMGERAAMYRIALERLVIALPSPMAVEAERQRLDLERRLAAIHVFAGGPQTTPLSIVSK